MHKEETVLVGSTLPVRHGEQALPEKPRMGFVTVSIDALSPEENPEATDLFLDFLGDCTIHHEDEAKVNGTKVKRFLISNEKLERLSQPNLVPYYAAEFSSDGSYEFYRRREQQEIRWV